MTRASLLLLAFGSAEQLAYGKYTCPSYDAIATPSITTSVLSDLEGEWYMLATNEPTMPSFVGCARTTWYLDSAEGSVKSYHYKMVTEMAGKQLPAITMKGEARDPKRPGLLAENAAFFNHSVAPYVPNMVFDIEHLPDGNTLGFNYACISGSMFSFNVFARRPTLSEDEVKALIQKQNKRVGGVFNVEGMHISDNKQCGWGESVPTPMSLGSYTCPSYDKIATPSIGANILHDMAGDWYMLATNEPTMPSFVGCARTTWSLDSAEGSVKSYHYKMVTEMMGKPLPAITMKGEARDPNRPGLLSENAAFFNHSVAPYVPNMIFDVEHLPDGNTLGFNYACITSSMFSFNVVARRPTLSADQVKSWIQKQSERVGAGVFNIENMHIADAKQCGWDSESVVVV